MDQTRLTTKRTAAVKMTVRTLPGRQTTSHAAFQGVGLTNQWLLTTEKATQGAAKQMGTTYGRGRLFRQGRESSRLLIWQDLQRIKQILRMTNAGGCLTVRGYDDDVTISRDRNSTQNKVSSSPEGSLPQFTSVIWKSQGQGASYSRAKKNCINRISKFRIVRLFLKIMIFPKS